MPPKKAQKSSKKDVLGPAEMKAHRELAPLIEKKNYKKALKNADLVLKKAPHHAETLALKGLTLHSMGKKEEGWVAAKQGLAFGLSSQLCWHVFALMHKAEHNWEQAAKCFHSAVRHESANSALVSNCRELMVMQFMARDIAGMSETGRLLIQHRPQEQIYWFQFAFALYLDNHLDLAADILLLWSQQIMQSKPFYSRDAESVDPTHHHMFMARVLCDSRGPKVALAHLHQFEAIIWDKTGLAEACAHYVGLAGDKEKEAALLRLLITVINAEDLNYFAKLRAALGLPADGQELNDDQCKQWLAELDAIIAAVPRAAIAPRLALRAVAANTGSAFDQEYMTRADALARPLLRKGVAAAFVMLGDPASGSQRRIAQLTTLVDTYLNSLEASGTLPDSEEEELPSVLFWTLFLRAQCAMAANDIEGALSWLDLAEAHTPTVIEVFSMRALYLKRAGDVDGAFRARERARKMDLADRYLNNKSAKYAFRAGMADKALDIVALFRAEGDALSNMHQMQVTWFEVEAGRCHLEANELGHALHHFLWVETHTGIIEREQLDFFGYAFRRGTMNTLVDFKVAQDELRAGPAWQTAAAGIVRAYLALADVHALPDGQKKGILASLTKAAPAKKSSNHKLEFSPPEAHELAACADPLQEASIWAQRLVQHVGTTGPFVAQAHRLQLVAQTRSRRFVLAMRSARIALEHDFASAELQRDVAVLLDAIDRAGASPATPLPEAVSEVLAEARTALPGGGDVNARLAALDEHVRAEVELALAHARGEDVSACVAKLVPLLASVSLATATRWFRESSHYGAATNQVGELRLAGRARFPRATAFKTAKERKQEKSAIAQAKAAKAATEVGF